MKLTSEEVDSIELFFLSSGLLRGVDGQEAHALMRELVSVVAGIAACRVEEAKERMKATALSALDEQQAVLFARWTAQAACGQ
jgi:hypothetical protein